MCSIYATTLITLFSNICYAGLLNLLAKNEHGRPAAAESQINDKQLQSNLLLPRDQLMLATELNKSHDQLVTNERRLWMTSKSSAGSESTRRRAKRKILRFEYEPQRKWPLPIKFKIDDNMSGKSAINNIQF